MIKGLYYWSVVLAAVAVLVIAIASIVMAANMIEPGLPLALLFVFLTLYVVVGVFIEGRDRE